MGISGSSLGQTTRSVFGERRYVTVLFSDVSGSSEHAERLEAEDYAELLAHFRRFARDIIARHGGSIARIQGDGVLALFGHAEPSEDDGRRAVQSALELHEAVGRLHTGSGPSATFLQMHTGIHAGLLLLIEGDIERGRHDVVGHVPNTAARLCSLAQSGEIFVSTETLGPHVHFFQTSPAQDVYLKGRPLALNVVRIYGERDLSRRIDAAARRGLSPFVGRQAPLNAMLQSAERVRDGHSGAVVLCGEPGIGKTRLLDEFERHLNPEQYRLLRGDCENQAAAAPLQPFQQALRELLQWRSGLSTTQNEAAAISALHSIGVDSGKARALLQGLTSAEATPSKRSAAIVDLLDLLSRRHTVVLLLDDWQWADDASRQLLEAVRHSSLPILVVLATRSGFEEDSMAPGAHMLHLAPLDPAAAESAIAAWLSHAPVNPFLTQEIYRQSGGSPLFIEELCHAAATGGAVPAMPRGAPIAWINALIASRYARLAGAEAAALQVASIIGHTIPAWLFMQLVGPAQAAALVESLSAQDFLAASPDDGLLRFKHVLAREAIYATVEAEQRKALHLKVAEALDASVADAGAYEWLEALAYHYDAAHQSGPAARYAEAAGDKAMTVLALDRARGHYITALRALDILLSLDQTTSCRWCEVAEKLGQACVFDPLGVDEGLVLFERAAKLARSTGDDKTIARAEYWLGYVNYGRGHPRRSVQHCESALRHAVACADTRLTAQLQATLGQALASAGRYSEALPRLAQATESKRQQSRPGSGAAIGSAYTVARTGYTLGDLGRFDEAHACFEEALHLLGGQLHPVEASVRELICAVHLWQGRWGEAQDSGAAGVAVALRCRSHYLVAMGRALSACAQWALTHDELALATLREATLWIEQRGGAVSTSLNYGWLVEACADLGLVPEARQHAIHLFRRARQQDRHGHAQGCRALARLALAQGEARSAQRYLAWADRTAAWRQSPREAALNELARAEMAELRQQASSARAGAQRAADAFRAMKMAWHAQRAEALVRRL